MAASVHTLKEFILRWRNGKSGLAEGTLEKLDCHVVMTERYMDLSRPVSDDKPQDIRDAVAKARSDLKGQTINETMLRLLRHAFDLAVEEKCIETNPVGRVKREKVAPIERKQFDWEDARKVLEEVRKPAYESYLILRAMLLLGIGQAECKALTGSAVDWKNRKVHFIRKRCSKNLPLHLLPLHDTPPAVASRFCDPGVYRIGARFNGLQTDWAKLAHSPRIGIPFRFPLCRTSPDRPNCAPKAVAVLTGSKLRAYSPPTHERSRPQREANANLGDITRRASTPCARSVWVPGHILEKCIA